MSTGDVTQGVRLQTVGELYAENCPHGAYVLALAADPTSNEDGVWYVRDPAGMIGSLRLHTVVEHDDGTITVSPSILDTGEHAWHGFLERGVWREV